MQNGGILGPKEQPSYFNGNGMRHIRDVGLYLGTGQWHFSSSVAVNATAFTEGENITITINTVGLPDGTNLYWTVNTLFGTTLSTADFTDKVLSATANIVNNTYTTTKKFVADRIPDGNREMTVTFRTESVEGPIIASTPVLTILDFARGGDSVFDRSGYRYHKFTYSGWFYSSRSIAAEVLVVAGGGGGGGNGGGGGGAGGVRWENVTIPASHPNQRWVQVGGGGAWSGGGWNGSDGGNSYIDGVITSTGGGGGGSRDGGSAGRYGGSGGGGGGGGGGRAGAGAGIPGQGNNGGSGYDNGADSAGGGGGGAAAAGGNGGYRAGGNGGGGRGIDFVRDGVTEFYGGGGGAGRTVRGTAGSDGQGQGANRGSGGHGESGGTAYRAGTNGDTGIVFIRYLIPT